MKKRVTRMLLIVTIIFAVCCLPTYVVGLFSASGNDFTYFIDTLSSILLVINSCANPIVYAFLSTNFRRSFRRTVLCKKKNIRVLVDQLEGRSFELEKKNDMLKEKVDKLEERARESDSMNIGLVYKVNDLEQQGRKNSNRIVGLSGKKGERNSRRMCRTNSDICGGFAGGGSKEQRRRHCT
ncbi:Somatostatin receptor type 4 [Mizuhopecten yessoensis]|uniref:Somatostatin receptor type 4 n=2 Tax=Mizuhopecten yessoensis TaxID=6573 RepID=A0A210QY79_MIZYE|nr:Somatostatin receptor type 4 [Mizuhopecten yessoensis]